MRPGLRLYLIKPELLAQFLSFDYLSTRVREVASC